MSSPISSSINTSVESLLGQLEADRLQALLLWYLAESGVESGTDTGAVSPKVQALLDDIRQLDAEAAYEVLRSLKTEDAVRFAVINEFGEGFSRRNACETLIRAIVRRMATQSAMNLT